jgi:hypothetical protein
MKEKEKHGVGGVNYIINRTNKARCGGSCLLLQLFQWHRSGGPRFEASPDKKLVRPSSQQTSQEWCCMPVIPAMWEAEVGGLKSEASPRELIQKITSKTGLENMAQVGTVPT